MKLKRILISLAFLTVVVLLAAFFLFRTSAPDYVSVETQDVDSLMVEEPVEEVTEEYLYGFRIDTLTLFRHEVERNQSLSEILAPYNVSASVIHGIAQASRKVFDVRKINSGRPITLICTNDSLPRALKLIYEPNRLEYVVYHLDDSLFAEKIEREVELRANRISGTIEHSLSVSIEDLGQSVQLTNDIVDVLAWQIDFFRLQKGDKFTVLFTEKVVENEVIGVHSIEAIQFEHSGNPYYAFAFDQGEGIDYFDEEGNSIRKALLRYPLEFSRISSRYTLNRFHPVQKRWKAHLGTDFAAPRGTPIRSVGDGIIQEAKFSQYNGNYVKVRHNGTYSTQYLHMSAIASGITPGTKVKQGQVIGFVGSTGLATGDHLCYRFWKNGVQVDALSVDLPPSSPVKEEWKEDFIVAKDSLIQRLGSIEIDSAAQ